MLALVRLAPRHGQSPTQRGELQTAVPDDFNETLRQQPVSGLFRKWESVPARQMWMLSAFIVERLGMMPTRSSASGHPNVVLLRGKSRHLFGVRHWLCQTHAVGPPFLLDPVSKALNLLRHRQREPFVLLLQGD